ncbi:cation diffusion facilitator family transporter [Puerhibacterium puerhi]|uniref:cation diffusion facilitator family transporter n=1 Tax=Puerhibacterium puerhi TaxID=2692623 RepID=UPI0013581033|nr:cation diffusion facilitator family transporter [Puerhibacterium puerhi]
MTHGHDHGAAGAAGAGSAPAQRRRLAVALGITVTVLVAEVVGAAVTGSLALLVDAGHMLTDAGGLLLALVAASLMARPATSRRTWGWRRAEVVAAGVQAAILLAVGVYALVEGARRLAAPPEVQPAGMLVIGAVGLVANVVCLAVLAGGRTANLNLRAAFLEVAADALGSVAVIAGAVVVATTGWERADAVAGMLVALWIVPRSVVILRESGDVLLETTPTGLDLDAVRAHLLALPHVREVHDLHAGRISTTLPVLSAHVVVDDSCFRDGHAPQVLDQLQDCVARHFPVSVEHSTFQLEPAGHAAHEHHESC